MTGRWKAALQIAEARRPRGEVAMTELMMMSQTVVEMNDEIERLRSELEEVKAANELLRREPPHGYTNMPNGTVVPYWLYPVKPTKKGTDQ